MLSKKDRIAQFKRDLKSLKYYKKRMDEIDDEIIRISRILYDPKTVRYGEKIGGEFPDELTLISKRDELRLERDFYENSIYNVESKLNKLSDSEKSLLDALYIQGKGFDSVASKKFVSVRSLKYKVNRIIEKII